MASKKMPSADVIERERKVLELRLLGLTWDSIATNVGYASAGAAWNAYKRALVRTLQEPAEELRQQEAERLNRMMTVHLQRAIQGDVPSATLVLRLMERRAKLLGLDSPTQIEAKTEVTYNGGGDIDAEVARLAQLLEQNSSSTSAMESPTSTT